jgi:hypothetical protein
MRTKIIATTLKINTILDRLDKKDYTALPSNWRNSFVQFNLICTIDQFGISCCTEGGLLKDQRPFTLAASRGDQQVENDGPLSPEEFIGFSKLLNLLDVMTCVDIEMIAHSCNVRIKDTSKICYEEVQIDWRSKPSQIYAQLRELQRYRIR